MASSVRDAEIASRRRKIYEARAGGVSLQQIAAELGVSLSLVRKDYAIALAEVARLVRWSNPPKQSPPADELATRRAARGARTRKGGDRMA